MPTDPGMAEAEKFLAEHADIENIELLIPDMCGILRGKRLTRESFGKLFSGDVRVPGSVCLLDATGRSVPTIHYGIADGDPDFFCRAVRGTLHRVPWSERPMGQVLGTMTEEDGTPLYSDTRAILDSVVRRFGELGLRPTVAIELEFYLLDREPDREGRPQPAFSAESGYRQSTTQVLGTLELGDFDAFLTEVDSCCRALGIPAEAASKEYAPGQYEINLHYVADALAACDQAVLLKRTVKAVAHKHGLIGSFMAKPFEDTAGSGLHVHVSLYDRKGNNALVGPMDKRLGIPAGPRLRHAVGGLIEAMPESMAIFAPNANSYRRFRPGVFAPISPSWGVNNRAVAVRIPPSDAQALRIEHRSAGADASPYLTTAAVLAAMHYGMVNEVEPPPPSVGDQDPQGLPVLPLNWWNALDRFKEGPVLPPYLGEKYHGLYEACRRFECESYHARIQPLDYDWYMRVV